MFLRRSSDVTRPSGADRSVNVADEEGTSQKCATLLLLRGLNPKRPCITIDGGHDSLCMDSVNLSLAGLEALA